MPDVTKVTDVTKLLSRRNVLMGAIASVAGIALVRCGADASSQAAQVVPPPAPVGPPPPPTWPPLLPPPPVEARMLLPGGGVLSALPGPGDLLSLTLDDGVDTGVVRAYCQLAKDRPPYGAYNDVVQSVAADLGYTETVLWDGNLGDDQILRPVDIVANANKYYTPQKVVISHLNHPPVTATYHQLLDIIAERQLRTVTLDDVFFKPEATRLTSAYPG